MLVQTGAHAFYQALEAGTLPALEPAVVDFRERFPGTAAWRAAHALLLAESGRTAEAGDLLDALSADGFGSVRRDRGWLLCIGIAAEVALLTKREAAADACYAALLPYRSLFLVIGSASLFYGGVELWLGRLATLRGRFDDARAHLQRALDAHRRMDALPWIARSLAARADLWGALGKSTEQAEDVTAALEIADDLGLTRLSARLRPWDAH